MLIIYLFMLLLHACLFWNVNCLKTGSGSTPLAFTTQTPRRIPSIEQALDLLPVWLA